MEQGRNEVEDGKVCAIECVDAELLKFGERMEES